MGALCTSNRSTYSKLLHNLPFDEFDRKYEFLGRSGQGAFASVRVARSRATGKTFAVKILRRGPSNSASDWELAKKEIETLKHLDHPNVVTLFEVYEGPSVVYLVEQLCSGGELYERAPYTEAKAAVVFKQLAVGLKYLHSQGIMHRDIKAENIMFESRHEDALPVFIDFGGAHRITRSRIFKRVGTPYAIAPEQLANVGYTKACDLWSMGVVLYMLLNNMEHPFQGATGNSLATAIRSGKYGTDTMQWQELSRNAKNLIARLLQINPNKRYTINQVLQHPWVRHTRIIAVKPDSQPAVTELNRKSVHMSLVPNFRRYNNSNMLQRKAMQVIAYRASPEEIRHIRELFFAMDSQNSGTINRAQFSDAFKGELDEDEVTQLFNSLDVDGNGHVSYSEFMAASFDLRKHAMITELGEAFDRLDVDHDGFISIEDCRTLLNDSLFDVGARSDLKKAFQKFDTDDDGKISWEEFSRLMMSNVVED